MPQTKGQKLIFALKAISPKEYKPMIVETAIICVTVCIMCPWMSFLATILYKGIFPAVVFNEAGFTISQFLINFVPNFLQTFVQNFPFALLSQLFFIQPLTRAIFRLLFKKKISKGKEKTEKEFAELK